MSDLDAIRADITRRLAETEEVVKEHARLQAALDALDGVARRASTTPPDGPRRRGRPRGSGTRAHEAIAAVTAEPGLTAGEIAERMGINQNYLYRVLPNLQQDGKLEKRGRGWYLPDA